MRKCGKRKTQTHLNLPFTGKPTNYLRINAHINIVQLCKYHYLGHNKCHDIHVDQLGATYINVFTIHNHFYWDTCQRSGPLHAKEDGPAKKVHLPSVLQFRNPQKVLKSANNL